MKTYKYKVYLRNNNTTALVMGLEGLETDKDKRNEIQDKIGKRVEQVGFVNDSPHSEQKLVMAGGEFCGNATRCAVWYYRDGKPTGKEGKDEGIVIKTSILDSQKNEYNLKEIKAGITSSLDVWTNVPVVGKLDDIVKKIGDGLYWVELDGIGHLVITQRQSKAYIKGVNSIVNENIVMGYAKALLKNYGYFDKDACGVMFLENSLDIPDIITMHPCVFINSPGTANYETACGSGSLAVALVSSYLHGGCNVELPLLQPSGKLIKATINLKGRGIELAKISGSMSEDGEYEVNV
jgi:diaminopimelate epimerase